MNALDPRRFALSDAENERIFRENIVPEDLNHAEPRENRHALLVGGQCGAGKTTLIRSLSGGEMAGAVVFGTDSLRSNHKAYHELFRDNHEASDFYTSWDARIWMSKAVDYCIRENFNM